MAEIKIKMDKTAIILSSIVGNECHLGICGRGAYMSALAFTIYKCIYLQSPMAALGICALVFLLMAQITVTAVSGCCGCCKSRAIPSETKRVIGVVCAVGSWIAAVAGCVMFEENAALNFRGVYIPGLYAGGGVLALAATALGIASYVLLRGQPADGAPSAAAKMPGEQSAPSGIAMGQPQFPQAASAGAPNMQSPPQGPGQV